MDLKDLTKLANLAKALPVYPIRNQLSALALCSPFNSEDDKQLVLYNNCGVRKQVATLFHLFSVHQHVPVRDLTEATVLLEQPPIPNVVYHIVLYLLPNVSISNQQIMIKI
jgi:hypothetical protein